MKLLHLLNGSTEFIQDNEGIKDVVSNHLGEDSAEVIQELIDQANYTERKIDTDLISYESSLESNTTAFQDINDNLEQLEKYLNNTKRIDRQYIRDLIENTYTIINNQI